MSERLRSATGNRVRAERCVEGSNPSLPLLLGGTYRLPGAPCQARFGRAFAVGGLRYDCRARRSGRVAEGGALLRR